MIFGWAFAFSLLFWLIVGHAVCDYPLQGEFLSKGKNLKSPIPGFDWWILMSAHCMIHAGMVVLITHSFTLGVFEFIVHYLLDCSKCLGVTNFREDQIAHVLFKFLWVGLLAFALV